MINLYGRDQPCLVENQDPEAIPPTIRGEVFNNAPMAIFESIGSAFFRGSSPWPHCDCVCFEGWADDEVFAGGGDWGLDLHLDMSRVYSFSTQPLGLVQFGANPGPIATQFQP